MSEEIWNLMKKYLEQIKEEQLTLSKGMVGPDKSIFYGQVAGISKVQGYMNGVEEIYRKVVKNSQRPPM